MLQANFLFSDNAVFIDAEKVIGPVNKNILGNNMIGYDPMTYEDWAEEFYGYSDFGSGIWDPRLKRPVKEAIELAKEAGVSVLRFPGGCGTHAYDWKNSVGNDRKHFLFGLDEFLEVCNEIQAEPVITVSYFTGSETEAADLVEYLNAPADQKHPWAMKRAENGHKMPYHVRYFEIGNEVYHGNHREIKKVEPGDYAEKYLKYYSLMKSVDASVQIGIVLHTKAWNQIIAQRIKGEVDFGIIHVYPTPAWGNKLETLPAHEIFDFSLALPVNRYEPYFKGVIELFKFTSGKILPLAITEFNGGYAQEKPVPYRLSLGCALVNAELIRIFMKPENNIQMANYWQFCNCYWGMVNNGFNEKESLYKPYSKFPNYYVFELYHKYFGDVLIESETQSQDLSVNASKAKDGKKIFLMVINKNLKAPVKATLNLGHFTVSPSATIRTLNGPDISSINGFNSGIVGITQKKVKINGSSLGYAFEAHSLTSIEVEAM